MDISSYGGIDCDWILSITLRFARVQPVVDFLARSSALLRLPLLVFPVLGPHAPVPGFDLLSTSSATLPIVMSLLHLLYIANMTSFDDNSSTMAFVLDRNVGRTIRAAITRRAFHGDFGAI